MKTNLTSLLRGGFVATLFSAPVLVFAAAPADRAADALASRGTVPATSAGRFVEIGTYRVQVAAKLGRPDATLPDGTWLYHGRKIENSAAQGTLVVRFEDGRVTSLSLATPAVVAALRASPRPVDSDAFVAAK